MEYDMELNKKYKDITASLPENNNGMCGICFCEFDDSDKDWKAESLVCKHQYHSACWAQYLRSKVTEMGARCVFTKCPQLRCNVVVPHSMFLKYIPDEVFEDGVNYREKYNLWHCKQFTDHSKNIKWCPQKNCNYIVEKNDFSMKDTVSCNCGVSFCFKCGNEDHVPASCN